MFHGSHQGICKLPILLFVHSENTYLLTRHSAYGKALIMTQMFLNYLPLLDYPEHNFWGIVKKYIIMKEGKRGKEIGRQKRWGREGKEEGERKEEKGIESAESLWRVLAAFTRKYGLKFPELVWPVLLCETATLLQQIQLIVNYVDWLQNQATVNQLDHIWLSVH